jgi:amino acid transporter
MEVTPTPRLQATVGRLGFFALAFGTVVGSGWVVILGDWLNSAGPGGAVVGFLAGVLVMATIALCYGELASRSIAAGGEFLYVFETLGPGPAFLVGWFLTLYGIAVCAFEAIVLSWLLRTLVPAIATGAAYFVKGAPVTWDALVTGWGGALLIGAIHYRGAAAAISFQNVVTSGFVLACLILILFAVAFGNVGNLQPLFAGRDGATWLAGSVWVFSLCAFFLNGWQTALHAIEERDRSVSVRSAVWSMVGGISAAALFYCAIVLSAAAALPWRRVAGTELPAVTAFASLTKSGALGTLVLVAAIVSISKTWNAVAWLATRLLFAQARHNLIPASFARLSGTSGTPRVAIVFVTAGSMIGVALGRAAILPIVNMASTCLGLTMILCIGVLLKRRRSESGSPSFVVPGGIVTIACAMIGALLMVGVAVVQPLMAEQGSIPVEWQLLAAWAALGVVVWLAKQATRSRRASAR